VAKCGVENFDPNFALPRRIHFNLLNAQGLVGFPCHGSTTFDNLQAHLCKIMFFHSSSHIHTLFAE
jgi:hypothetical protein